MNSEKKYSLKDIDKVLTQVIEESFDPDKKNIPDENKKLLFNLINRFYKTTTASEQNSSTINREYFEYRMENLVNSAMSLAQLDFNKGIEMSNNDDEFDGLAVALNMLKEELKGSTVSKEFLNDTFNSMKDIVLVVDIEENIKSANMSAFSALEYAVDEIIDTPIREILFANDDNGELQEYFLFSSQNESLQLKTKSGRTIPVDISISRMHDSHGVVVIARDITERLKIELKQKQLVTDLKRKNTELKEFAYIMSHDIKSPLRGIAQLSEWVYADNKNNLNEESLGNLKMITGRIKRLYGYIEGLYEYAKIGRIDRDSEAVDTKTIVEEVIQMQEIPKNITIKIDTDLPTINIVRIHAIQVFQNLISNAIKYNDKPQGVLNIGCNSGRQKVFYIKDNGIGINQEQHKKIFKLFQTIAAKDTIESTGIGLSIVKKITDLYDGDVWIESNKDNGCVFYFYFDQPNTFKP